MLLKTYISLMEVTDRISGASQASDLLYKRFPDTVKE